jgi:hypothetical protein
VVFFTRRKRPKSAAEVANEAEIEKLSEEATWGELDNEERVVGRGFGGFGRFWRMGPVGFFNSPGVKMPDDKPYVEETSPADKKV